MAVLERRREVWDAGIAASADRAPTAREKILAVFDFLDAWFREPDFRGCAFINFYGELSGGAEDVQRTVRQQKEHFGAYMARLVHEAGAPASLAPQLVILAEGAQTTAAITKSPTPATQARAAAQTLLAAALD
nr:hypothetical protein GCM10025732_00470 [Glycomyces mayteni]